ncbi:hypothetical protein AVEN_186929-1 [Araneus ventricosus]|uniref:DUF7041 domain-containing protein n=1 Tax=Araneus ventricosus TaxID=182803 RepID=A0A4Y2L3L8_ARAVE|nr:hypothetical protein AVEN_186929-1 [Araneus ventricosus]
MKVCSPAYAPEQGSLVLSLCQAIAEVICVLRFCLLGSNIAGDNQDSAINDTTIARVGVKLPPFWKANPELWNIKLEAPFTLDGITVDDTKFNHVISEVDSEILNSVSDIILRPPDSYKYIILEKRLIELDLESEASKIRTLLQGLELDDQRPS